MESVGSIILYIIVALAMVLFSGEKLHWNNVAAFACLIAAVCFTFLPQSK